MTSEEKLKFANAQRKAMGDWDINRDRGLKIPKDVKCFFDIAYSKDADCCKLDVYYPTSLAQPKSSGKKAYSNKLLPVIVSVHGGGWVYGDKELYSFYCMELARRGFAVVNYTYRLAPEYKFPSALIDTNNVFKWIFKAADDYGFDTNNIFATGDSAGGNYLATYAAICTNKKFATEFPFKVPTKLKFNAVYLNCGMYDFTNFMNLNTKKLAACLMPKEGTKHELELVSPILHITENFPPAYLVTAEHDFLKTQVPPLAKKFFENEVEFKYKCYHSGKKNKLGHVFMLNLKDKASAPAIDEQCDFFREYLK